MSPDNAQGEYPVKPIDIPDAPWRRDNRRGIRMGMRRLRSIRKKRRLTQAQLAAMVGADQSQISKIERGDEAVSLGRIYEIAAALNVSPAELFDPNELQDRILRAVYALPEDQQAAAVRILEAMAEPKPPPKK